MFILGFLIGGLAGIFVTALCSLSSACSREEEDRDESENKDDQRNGK